MSPGPRPRSWTPNAGPPPSAPTPWLQPADRYSARCEQSNGANVLMAQSIGNARKLNPSPTPDWGLHLGDANLPLGDLVDVVGREASAYLKGLAKPGVKRPRLSLAVRCVRRGLRVGLGGADRRLVRRMDVLIRGHRVARDRTAPFSQTVRRAPRVRVVLVLRDGRRVMLTRRVRACR